jgi:hypothetical protein
MFSGTHVPPFVHRIVLVLCLVFGASAFAGGFASLEAQVSPVETAHEEAAYAVSIMHVADSAIHRLDFFPARSQLRVQMLFMTSESANPVFSEIGSRSLGAALVVDEIATSFEGIRAPDDLRRLHAELVSSLHAARAALDRLAASANACQVDVSSVQRCQSPFTAASSALGQAYKRYLDTRVKIKEQIADTQTLLPDFKLPAPANRT